MMRWIHKLATFVDYTYLGMKVGATLRSKLVLVSLLPRLKWSHLGVYVDDQLHNLDIWFGATKRRIYIRTQDIFILYEILGKNPYILPDMGECPPRCIIDLGSHVGLATLQFKAHFPSAEIHCYEPDPDSFYLLQLNTAELPGVFLHREAVAGQRGVATFYVRRSRHAGSSLYRVDSDRGPGTNEIQCELKLLDDCLSETKLPVDVVKFDIEGAEFDVFSQSRRVHDVRFIVGELKGTAEDIGRFLALFPRHQASVRWIGPNIAYVALRLKPFCVKRSRLQHANRLD